MKNKTLMITDNINDIRSNIIELLMRLYKQFEDQGDEVHMPYESKVLHFVPGQGLWIEGCADRVFIKDYRYSTVSLGDKIRSCNHLPYIWLCGLVDGEER